MDDFYFKYLTPIKINSDKSSFCSTQKANLVFFMHPVDILFNFLQTSFDFYQTFDIF